MTILDDDVGRLLAAMNERLAEAPRVWDLDLARLRVRASESLSALTACQRPDCRVEQITIEGPFATTHVRVYRPTGGGHRHGLVYLHGGGWLLGDLDFEDLKQRELCVRSGGAVLAVDYVLAPEHAFPAPVDDCFAAWRTLRAQAATLGLDVRRLALGGASAGANLALAVARRAVAAGIPPARLLLFYGVYDQHLDTPSMRQFSQGYWLEARALEFFRDAYCRDRADWTHPDASPGLGTLEGLPKTLVVAAGHDPLLDDSRRLVASLALAHVPVEFDLYPGSIHGFTVMPNRLASARCALARAARFVIDGGEQTATC